MARLSGPDTTRDAGTAEQKSAGRWESAVLLEAVLLEAVLLEVVLRERGGRTS
jgi:hypothetical protein